MTNERQLLFLNLFHVFINEMLQLTRRFFFYSISESCFRFIYLDFFDLIFLT